jgi:uncharacterized membrane protein
MAPFPDVVINVSWISAAAGTLLTLLASYVPGFNEKFASLSTAAKQLYMLLAIAVVTAVIAVLTFTRVWPNTIPPTKEGAIGLVVLFIETVIANQAVYKIIPQTNSVRKAKAASKARETTK